MDSLLDSKDLTNECHTAMPVSMTDEGNDVLLWQWMCTTLNDTIGCSGLQNQEDYPYKDFQTCCVNCEQATIREGNAAAQLAYQMECCSRCPPETPPSTVATEST